MKATDAQGEGPVLKPTRFWTNIPAVAHALDRKCTGCERHVQLVGGRAKQAGIYPRQLVDAILDGLERHYAESHGQLSGFGGEEPGTKRQRVRLDRDTEVDVEWSQNQTAQEPRESMNTGGASASSDNPNSERPNSYDEVEAHRSSGHAEYQSWCSACVAGRGRERMHRRKGQEEKDEESCRVCLDLPQ